MKRLSYLLILLLCYACQSDDEPIVSSPAPAPLKWETTSARINGGFGQSKRIQEDQLLIHQKDRLITLDSNLEVNTLFEFDVEHFGQPAPMLSDRFFVIAEVMFRHLPLQDSIGYHIYPLDNPANKYVLDIMKVREEISNTTNSTNQNYDVDIAVINSNDRILFTFRNIDKDNNAIVLYDIVYNGGPISLENRLIIDFPDLDLEDMKSITSWGEYFYISSYDAVYQMDGQGNISKIANEGMDGEFFEFNEQLHMGSTGITADWFSEDGGLTWNKTEDYDYFSLYPLGAVNDKLVYIIDEDQWHGRDIYLTNDLIDAEKLAISNDESGLEIKRLQMMGNYLYGVDSDNNGLIMRIDLSKQ